jgi:copper chaperone CopZ
MKSIQKGLITMLLLLSATAMQAQIKNAKTDTVTILGNCGMCQKNIAKAGNIKNVALVKWNKDTKVASITYDANQTNQDEILKRIALAGYDSEKNTAPNAAYKKLSPCCQYDREVKESN